MNNNNHSPKKGLYLILLGQAILVMVVSIAWIRLGYLYSLSALVGGVLCLVPSLLCIELFFRNWQLRQAGNLLLSLFGSELVKLIATVIFAVGFAHFYPLYLLPFLSGLVTAYLGFWLVAAVLMIKNRKLLKES